MFTVTRYRAFVAAGFGWTVRVECVGPQLDAVGRLGGVDFGEFWQWLTDHICAVPGVNGPELLEPQQGGRLQNDGVGLYLTEDAESLTAERFAAVLLVSFRELSDMVRAVTVIRTRLVHADDSTEATVRVAETEPVTAGELVDAFRRFAELNQLHMYSADAGVV